MPESILKPKPPLAYKKLRERSAGPWDVIVIGSGMGGMSAAAALAKQGKKILILEQHYVPGGFTHVFSRKGFTWDVGVHAIGEMRSEDYPGKIFRWLTNNEVPMIPLGDPYDKFYFPDGFEIDFPDEEEVFIQRLVSLFPEEAAAIDKYRRLVNSAYANAIPYMLFKTFPKPAGNFASKCVDMIRCNWWKITTQSVLEEITKNKKLRAVLSAQWGYYGSVPVESSFAIHALTTKHFWNGAWYPARKASAFANSLLRTVERAGGETIVRASVKNLIVYNGKAVGVELEDGQELFARRVISSIGAIQTVSQLVPPKYNDTSWSREILKQKSSPPYLCLNLGFEGEIQNHGATRSNKWFMETWDMNQTYWDVNDPKTEAHILYVSFPSMKDPHHEAGPALRNTGECVTFVDWNTFKQWENTRRGQRDKDYRLFKEQIEQRLVRQMQKHMPKLMDKCVHHELSTPLSANFFTRANHGSIYGLEATPARFCCDELRARTPIKNFYMTGVDVTTPGVVGAMLSGIITAATIDPRIYKRMLL